MKSFYTLNPKTHKMELSPARSYLYQLWQATQLASILIAIVASWSLVWLSFSWYSFPITLILIAFALTFTYAIADRLNPDKQN